MNKSILIAFLIMFIGWGSTLAQTDYDCFIGKENGKVMYYERQNSGAGSMSFSAVTGSSNPLYEDDTGWRVDVGMHSTPAFVDIDGDGDQDCFIGTHDGYIYYLKNTGNSSSPTFVKWDGNAESADPNPFYNVDVGLKAKPAFVDIDGDGDYDCFIGETEGNINYYKNNGDSSDPDFDEVTGSNNPFNSVDVGTKSVPAFVDIDGDGDYDCFIGEYNGSIKYYKNTGNSSSATFTVQTGGNNPFNGVDVGWSSDPEFVDIDGDGDYDCFIGEYYGEIKYYENTGNSSSATFTVQTGGDNPFNGVDDGSWSKPTFVNIDGDASLPVELTSFHVLSTRSDAITLQWVTESEINNLGFILDRRVPGTEWTEIATYITHPELQGQGSVTHQTIYSYTDNTVLSDETYDYRLADVDYDGNKVYHSMTVMGVSPNDVVPETFTLYPAYPNPFNPVTTIRFDIPEGAANLLSLRIFDINGGLVETLMDGQMEPGIYTVQWDGSDQPSGVYFSLLESGSTVAVRKLILLK